MAWTRLGDFKVPKSLIVKIEKQKMKYKLDQHHASNELGCLNLRELNCKIIDFQAKNNSPNLRLKANEMNAIESFHSQYSR